MTATSTEANTDTEAAAAAASAVLRALPGDLTSGAPTEGADALGLAVPGPGSKAVTASLTGDISGTLVLILSAEVATQVENGPIGPQELVAGLEVALTDASAALATTYGNVRHTAALALDAEVALSSASEHDSIVVVPLSGPAGFAGSVVVLIDFPIGTAGNVAGQPASNAATFETLPAGIAAGLAARSVELLNDVEMGITAELGRTRMTVRELLSLQPGSVVELDRAAGSPVDLLVNGTLVARGEVVVVDEEFGVRITEIIGYDAKRNGQP